MRLDQYSNPIFQDSDIFELIYSGNSDKLDDLIVDTSEDMTRLLASTKIYATSVSQLDYSLSLKDIDTLRHSSWYIPDYYAKLDIKTFCREMCSTQDELNRVNEELLEFENRNMLNVLRTLKYIVDTLRENKIVWGVGRGSSVSSYVLFIIGVHKIDSIAYNLNWREFLR